MSDFYAIRNTSLKKDFNLIKRLELEQRQLEDRVFNSKKIEGRRKFTAHPKRILSDSDTTPSNSPRILYNISPSASIVEYGQTEFQNRRQKAQNLHKKLHEKLSLIDSHCSRRTDDFSAIGDNYMVSQKSVGDRFQNRPIDHFDESSVGEPSSLEFEQDFEPARCKSSVDKKNLMKTRLENNYSVASKVTSGTERKSAGNKVSSQSICTRGLSAFAFEKKFKVVVEKSLNNISEIRSTLTKGITPPDGEEDESRILVRNKEFSNRFSRNYLYPLARQLQELGTVQQLNPLLVNQKILSTYQLVGNGLQAYQSHLPTSASVSNITFNQLKILMADIIELCRIHREHVKEEEENYLIEFIETLKINAELTTQKVDEYTSKPPATSESALKSENSNISLTKYGEDKKKTLQKTVRKKGNVSSRFSMYAMTASFRNDPSWKRAVNNLAKNKFNVKSKYKTATYKHRPPVEKDSEILSIPKLKTLFPKRSGVLRTTRLDLPINEDCIKTMVEVERNGSTHLEKEEWENMEKKNGNNDQNQSNKEEILMKLLQFAIKNHKEGIKDEDQLHISEILELVKKEPNTEFLNKVLDGLNIKRPDEHNKENQEGQQLTLEIVKSQHSFSDGGGSVREKCKRREPKITVSGDKNARLICITDDNSISEPPQDDDVTDKLCQSENAECAKNIIRTSSETQTDVQLNENNGKTVTKTTQKGKNSSFVKISRLKKCGKNLKPLDKKQAVDAIQYKLDFYRHSKNNPMYKKSTTCQPWILMGKISEELLNHCLLAVAREIEVNDIAERVYQSELLL